MQGQPSNLPQLVQLVNGKWRGYECHLQGRHFKVKPGGTAPPRPPPDAGAPLGWAVAVREQEINFQSPSFNARCIFDLAPHDASATHAGTCFVETEGTTLKEGYLDLAVTGRLVFGPNCKGITLSNMTIRGTTLACSARPPVFSLRCRPRRPRCCSCISYAVIHFARSALRAAARHFCARCGSALSRLGPHAAVAAHAWPEMPSLALQMGL